MQSPPGDYLQTHYDINASREKQWGQQFDYLHSAPKNTWPHFWW